MSVTANRPTSTEINRARDALRSDDSALKIYNQLIDYVHSLEGPLPESNVGFTTIETETCLALAEFYDSQPDNE